AELAKRGLPKTGCKQQLYERLCRHLQSEAPAADSDSSGSTLDAGIIDDQSTGGQEATEGAAGDLAALRKEVEELEIKALTRRRAQLQRELNGNQTAVSSQGRSRAPHRHTVSVPILCRLSLAPSTRKSYASHLRLWREFCRQQRVFPTAASKSDVCNFTAFLLERGCASYSSVQISLSAVSFIHRATAAPDPTKDNARLALVCRGARRLLSRQPRRAEPLQPHHLRLLCNSPLLQQLLPRRLFVAFKAALLDAWWGVLRLGELLPSTTGAALRRGALSTCPGGLRLTIGKSKTNQFKERQLLVFLPQCTDCPQCLVSALATHLRENQVVEPHQPLFAVLGARRV
uniref:Core-binding (CB) domain-containing protein n=1 Tax=Macrostomum lignano TaxID=282301 RepID=A0A1I8J2F9_9PLAT